MDIIKRIKAWSEIQNRPPVNDQMFYDIVIDTLENQLDEESFLQAITDQDIDVTNVYKRYEDFRNCLLYYRTKKNETCAADRESAAQQQKTKMDEMDDCF